MDRSYAGHSNRRKGVEDFPVDVLRRIFSHLPPISVAYCSTVCSSWHKVIQSSPRLWRSAYLLDRTRLEAYELESASASSDEKPDADWRYCFVKEEQKVRLGRGDVSVRSWKAHSGRVNCCRMDLERIVSGSSDQMIRIWCAKTLKCMEQYKVPRKAPVVQLDFDENKVIGAAGSEVLVWTRRGDRRLLRQMGGYSEIHSMCYADPDLVAGCADGTVRVFDLYSSRCTQLFRLHIEPVKAVVMDVATESMASGSADGTVQLYDARSGQRIASLLRPSSMTGITSMHLFAMERKLLAGTKGGDVYCFDLRSRKTLWASRYPGGAVTCLHSPKYATTTFVVGTVSGAVHACDINVGEIRSPLHIASFQAKPSRLPSSPILDVSLGLTKLVTAHADSTMALWHFGEAAVSSAGTSYGREEVVELPSPVTSMTKLVAKD